jgi:hypothetical protein
MAFRARLSIWSRGAEAQRGITNLASRLPFVARAGPYPLFPTPIAEFSKDLKVKQKDWSDFWRLPRMDQKLELYSEILLIL